MTNRKTEKAPETAQNPPKEKCSLITRLEALRARKPSRKAFGWVKIAD